MGTSVPRRPDESAPEAYRVGSDMRGPVKPHIPREGYLPCVCSVHM